MKAAQERIYVKRIINKINFGAFCTVTGIYKHFWKYTGTDKA
jgi:hypothetical protein